MMRNGADFAEDGGLSLRTTWLITLAIMVLGVIFVYLAITGADRVASNHLAQMPTTTTRVLERETASDVMRRVLDSGLFEYSSRQLESCFYRLNPDIPIGSSLRAGQIVFVPDASGLVNRGR